MDLYMKAIQWVLDAVLGYRGLGASWTKLSLIRGIRRACFGKRMTCNAARQAARKAGVKKDWKLIVSTVADGSFLTKAIEVRDGLSEVEAREYQLELDYATALDIETALAFKAALASDAAETLAVIEADHAEALEYDLELATRPS